MKCLHFNFDEKAPIPKSLYDLVWKTSDEMKQDFWGSDIHDMLELYLGKKVFEINK